jgi:hypothetical protein
MNENPSEEWEARLQRMARNLPYPPTPNLVGLLRSRLTKEPSPKTSRPWRLVWATVILVAVLAGLMTVPQVRAAVLRVLHLGAVEIIVDTTPTPLPAARTPEPASPTPLASASVLDLAGVTTLAEAQAQVDFPIRLPTHPPNLGPPDGVFAQNLGGPVVVLVWLDSERPDRVRLSLHQLGPGAFVWKIAPEVVQETTVNGQRALWTSGPYMLVTRRGDLEQHRLVEGHVLIWTEGEITYRMETDLTLEETVRSAESLQ